MKSVLVAAALWLVMCGAYADERSLSTTGATSVSEMLQISTQQYCKHEACNV